MFSPDFINADLQQRVMERKHWTPDQCDAFIAKFASKHDCVVHPLVRWLALFESWANGERLPDQANGVSNWWTTEAATIAKGRTLGVEARAGEAMAEFKGRIFAAIAQARSLSKSEQRARTATSVFESAIPAPQAERDITAECERLDD